MLREAQIPIVLWISAAAMLHIGGGTTVKKISDVVGETREIVAFSRAVRTIVRPAEIEIALEPQPDEPKEEELSPPLEPAPEVLLAKQSAEELPPPAPEPTVTETPEPPEPEQPPPPAPPAPIDPAKLPQELLLPRPDGRLAIRQHVEKGQADNPNAARIADDANHTAEETMARVRAYDQDSPDPSPGKSPGKSQETPGDGGDKDETGFAVASEDKGDTRPGEEEGQDKPAPPAAPREAPANQNPQTPEAATAAGQLPVPATPGQDASRGGTGPSPSDALATPDGSYSLDPSGGDGKPVAPSTEGRRALAGTPGRPGPLGFGAVGPYNLSLPGLVDAIGAQQLEQEREKARNTRLTKHRGAFAGADFERYRAAIENYDPSVKLGNQTSLNAAQSPFAGYINLIHNRIHPIFADTFLRSLERLPKNDPLNQNLVTHVEVVLDRTGRIVRRGITKPSGVTAFDVGALKSVEMAGPFGKPPDVIVSPDGRVYIHWEFHRDPYYACTSRFARPYLLKTPAAAPLAPQIDKPPPPPSADQRKGAAPR